LLAAWGCGSHTAHDHGHSHDHDHDHAEAAEPEPVAVTVFTEKVGLFMEYPRLVPGLEARFLAHVTVLATGEPVRTGRLDLELSGPDGFARTLEAAAPERDGLFVPVGAFEAAGTFDARIVVHSEQGAETIPLGALVVHADLEAAHAAAHAEEGAESADAVPFLLEQQWRIGVLTEVVRPRTLVRRLRVPAQVAVPTHAAAVVGAPLAGRVLPPATGALPRLGQRVAAGETVASVEPPLEASDLAQRAANETEWLARRIELEHEAVELGRDLSQAEASLEFAERALARLEVLAERKIGTTAELEAARRDAELARRAREGAHALAAANREALSLLAELAERTTGGDGGARLRLPLASPISGEIVEAAAVHGQHVDAAATLYRVLDLSRVWLVGHVSEFDLAELPEAPGAFLELPGHPGRILDVEAELGGHLVHVGREVDPDARTLPVRFEVANPDGLLRAGMLADLFLATETAREVVAVPRSAVVTDRGQPVAFVLLDGETFERRVLETGIRDGAWLEVRTGITAGERVVSKGAHLVKLASANPDGFGAGHVH
jgi:hypothetical protein